MSTNIIIRLVLWLVLFFVLLDIGFGMLSSPYTIWNITGLLILAITVIVTFKTKCLTEIKFKEHEK